LDEYLPACQNPDFVYLDTDGGALMHGCVFTHAFMHIYKKNPSP